MSNLHYTQLLAELQELHDRKSHAGRRENDAWIRGLRRVLSAIAEGPMSDRVDQGLQARARAALLADSFISDCTGGEESSVWQGTLRLMVALAEDEAKREREACKRIFNVQNAMLQREEEPAQPEPSLTRIKRALRLRTDASLENVADMAEALRCMFDAPMPGPTQVASPEPPKEEAVTFKHAFRKRVDGRPECICMRPKDDPLHDVPAPVACVLPEPENHAADLLRSPMSPPKEPSPAAMEKAKVIRTSRCPHEPLYWYGCDKCVALAFDDFAAQDSGRDVGFAGEWTRCGT